MKAAAATSPNNNSSPSCNSSNAATCAGTNCAAPGRAAWGTPNSSRPPSSSTAWTATATAAATRGKSKTRWHQPPGASGPALLTYPNFKTIKVYNNADSYALAIGLIADGISGNGGIEAAWPRDEQPLTRDQAQRLQQTLSAQGYDTKGTDGVLGANTRRAFAAWQAANGQTPDGFISQRSAAALIQ